MRRISFSRFYVHLFPARLLNYPVTLTFLFPPPPHLKLSKLLRSTLLPVQHPSAVQRKSHHLNNGSQNMHQVQQEQRIIPFSLTEQGKFALHHTPVRPLPIEAMHIQFRPEPQERIR